MFEITDVSVELSRGIERLDHDRRWSDVSPSLLGILGDRRHDVDDVTYSSSFHKGD